MSGTNAQSPTAQTLGQSGTPKNWFTSNRPRSFAQGSEEMIGLGTVPAVHTKVRDGIETPSVKRTLSSVTLLTRVLRRTCTPRSESTFSVYGRILSTILVRLVVRLRIRIVCNMSFHKLV